MLCRSTISETQTNRPDVFAFHITGEVTADDLQAMASYMNDQFDQHDSVSMLLIFQDFQGQKTGAGFDVATLKAQIRALSKVQKYAVVGAPDAANTLIDVMNKIIPVEARHFARAQQADAWDFVGANAA